MMYTYTVKLYHFSGLDPKIGILANNGDCEFYQLFESRFLCSHQASYSYIQDFEYELCEEVDDNLDLFEDEVSNINSSITILPIYY